MTQWEPFKPQPPKNSILWPLAFLLLILTLFLIMDESPEEQEQIRQVHQIMLALAGE